MFFKRPSLKRGGMPTGIDTLSPRVQANSGFFGTSQIRPMPSITGDFGRYNVGLSGGELPFQERMMKSFPLNAVEMGVASVVKPTKATSNVNEDIDFSGLDSDFTVTETVIGPDGKKIQAYAEPQPSAKVLANLPEFMGGISIYSDEYKDLVEKEKQKEIQNNLKKEKSDDGFLPNAGPKPVNFDKIAEDVVTNKKIGDDTPKELTFDDIYQTEYNRLEKLIGGREDEKGMLAIALSDAIGTEGTIADKAAALNKSLLKIVGERKANRRDIAKLAYSATKEIEKAKIAAGKVSDSQKNLNRAEKLVGIINNKNSSKEDIAAAKSELKNLKDAVGIFSKKDTSLSSTDSKLIQAFDKLAIKLSNIEDKNSDIYKKTYAKYIQARSLVSNIPEAGQNILFNDALAGLTVKKDGGRIGYAMGTPEPNSKDMSDVPAEPVEQNLSFEQLRSRLPKEITDDIVRLISGSSQALQDFAYIRTQGDVNKFNMKYGVNLVLPAQA